MSTGPLMTRLLYTPKEAAEQIGCCENHVRNLIADGTLRPVDIARKGARRPKTRVRRDDLERYIDQVTRTIR